MRKGEVFLALAVVIVVAGVGWVAIMAQQPVGGSETYAEASRFLFNAQRASDPVEQEALLQQAVVLYSRVLREYPEHVNAYVKRGTAYAALGAWERAVADYNAALRLDPTCSEALMQRGIAYEALGNARGALLDYEAFLSITEDAPYGGRLTREREAIQHKLGTLRQQEQVAKAP